MEWMEMVRVHCLLASKKGRLPPLNFGSAWTIRDKRLGEPTTVEEIRLRSIRRRPRPRSSRLLLSAGPEMGPGRWMVVMVARWVQIRISLVCREGSIVLCKSSGQVCRVGTWYHTSAQVVVLVVVLIDDDDDNGDGVLFGKQ